MFFSCACIAWSVHLKLALSQNFRKHYRKLMCVVCYLKVCTHIICAFLKKNITLSQKLSHLLLSVLTISAP